MKKPVRKPARKHHQLPYYEEILSVTFEPSKIFALLEDAAHQPVRILSQQDFEKLYWLAQDNLKGAYA